MVFYNVRTKNLQPKFFDCHLIFFAYSNTLGQGTKTEGGNRPQHAGSETHGPRGAIPLSSNLEAGDIK